MHRVFCFKLGLISLSIFLLFSPILAQTTKIAVTNFEIEGDTLPPHIGHIIAEWLTTVLVEDGRLQVVERRLVKELLAEQKLDESGFIDQNQAVKTGQILGVETLVTGTVLQFMDTIEVNARIVHIEQGVILAAEKVRTRDLSVLEEDVEKLGQALIGHLTHVH